MSITIQTLQEQKAQKHKFACLSLYDATFATFAQKAGTKVLLVGDSLGMVVQNKPNTLEVTMRDMEYHTRNVSIGVHHPLIIADMPFASYATVKDAQKNAARLMRKGAHMVKLEGGSWLGESIAALLQIGIPVCAHIGLTPQFIHLLGGYKVQGQHPESSDLLYETAMQLQDFGANCLLLECVPAKLAKIISEEISIPVIGIGAGWDTDGQVLVAHDILGMNSHTLNNTKPPRFVHNFLESTNSILGAMQAYVQAVESLDYPAIQHCYS